MKTNIEILQEYAIECGLENIIVNEKTLILYDIAEELGSLLQQLDSYIHIEIPYKVTNKKSSAELDIYDCCSGVFIVNSRSNLLLMFIPIYKCDGSAFESGTLVIKSHESESGAVVFLNNLKESFSYRTGK